MKDIANRKRKNKGGEDDSEWEDVDEHEKEVFQTTGYFDVPEGEAVITAADQKMLEDMDKSKKKTVNFVDKDANNKDKGDGVQDLASMIMAKMTTGDFIDGDQMDNFSKLDTDNAMDPKVIAAYRKVAIVLRSYKSGKLPKAFKIIP